MLAINTENKLAIYSLGKTGTTSFTQSIENLPHWHSVGEMDAQFMNELYEIPEQGVHGWEKHYVDQLTALDMLVTDRDYQPIFIVRNPWKRYVSGILEVLQDSLSIIFSAEEYNKILKEIDDETLTNHLDRLYYLSEFKKQSEWHWDKEFPFPSDFALHYNYHTRNWLYEIEKYDNALIVDTNQLNSYMSELEISRQTANVSDTVIKNRVENCLKNTNIYFYIERYLQSEIERYQKLL